MRVYLDLDYDEAVNLRDGLKLKLRDGLIAAMTEDMIGYLDRAIGNEDERRGAQHAEQLLESGGTDDSAYRRDMIDAGRGHLLR